MAPRSTPPPPPPPPALSLSLPLSLPLHLPQPQQAAIPISSTPEVVQDEFDPGAVCNNVDSEWSAVFNKNVPQAQRRLGIDLVHTLEHDSVVCCVRFSPDGKYLATGCNYSAQIFDTRTGVKTCVLMHSAAVANEDVYVRTVCFSPDGKLLVTGAEDMQIRIWDIAAKAIRFTLAGHKQEVYSIDVSRDARLLVSGSGDRTARLWDMETRQCIAALSVTEPAADVDVDTGVTSVAISPDGGVVAVGYLDNVVRVWEVRTGRVVGRLAGHADSVYSVAFAREGRGVVSGSLDRTLRYWELGGLLGRSCVEEAGAGEAGEEGRTSDKGCASTVDFRGHKDYALSVAVSHDGRWVVSGSKDRSVRFWDLDTGKTELVLRGHRNSVISVDVGRSGGMLATGGGDCIGRIWSYTDASMD